MNPADCFVNSFAWMANGLLTPASPSRAVVALSNMGHDLLHLGVSLPTRAAWRAGSSISDELAAMLSAETIRRPFITPRA
ncbi:hypothetical protein I1E95_06600 [Synechococcus sp. CBW1107]|jgi:hypothetical protein|uniref:hypothetical protein n=1 Tax=Synechococcus sp. CBW1107 TaxID=2789857 RepID=UPI0018CD2C47|nr:hypothetical protein [Synechococcus sp. CBW1107]QPN57735.1 hypothetical protein I1E95_06600 [Synechococcus sp. CBW1107]CAK6686824.1 hypothetical protein BBFGKLBO_00090 [Synechococcus sp. CBW1107]